MPKMLKVIYKKDILSLFAFVQDKLLSPKFYGLNEENKVVKFEIIDRMHQAEKCMSLLDSDMVLIYNGVELPEIIRLEWEKFDRSFDGNISDACKQNYKFLIDQTLALVNSIRPLPIESKSKDELPSKAADKEGFDEKLSRLTKSRESLKNEIEKQEAKTPKNENYIQNLKAQLKKMDSEYVATIESKKKITSDQVVGQNISNEVTEAFEKLKAYTSVIEDERGRAKWEYYISLVCIPVLILSFVALYGFFIHDLVSHRNEFSKFLDFLPYTAAVPFFIALLWLCVYLKDRASKISIELSTRLFNIHYLEGLMQMSNSLSISPEESIKRLDKTMGMLMDNYLAQVKDTHVTEMDIAKLEMTELKSNPYWKILQEIKSLIKLIKQ